MPNLIATRTVKARKPHYCRCCFTVAVDRGEVYTKDTFEYDGRLYDWIVCGDCRQLTNVVWEWIGRPDEGVGEDDFLDWARDHLADPDHSRDAEAFIARRTGLASL